MEANEGLPDPTPMQGEIIEAPRYGKKTKYLAEYCQRLVEMAQTGKTNAHFRVKYNISRSTFDRWCANYDEFKAAREIASDAREDYYHSAVHAVALNLDEGKRYNYPALLKLFDFHSEKAPREAKASAINVNVNIDNTGKTPKELSPPERQQRLEELKQKFLEDKQLLEDQECPTSLTELQDL